VIDVLATAGWAEPGGSEALAKFLLLVFVVFVVLPLVLLVLFVVLLVRYLKRKAAAPKRQRFRGFEVELIQKRM